ncbi:MAG: pyrroline-5-carboxylate reductase [Cellvibrionales bacterium]|nr:pyrroline-5-carboxylate reductase [Cellvibrionales bacterium]
MASIGFVGGGGMASALIGGLVKQGVAAAQILVAEPVAAQRDMLRAQFSTGEQLRLHSDSSQMAAAEVVVLAVKPQILRQVAVDLRPYLAAQALVISIAAGIPIAALERWLGPRPIVRCMPNTAALVGHGAAGLFANAQCDAAQRQRAGAILGSVGLACWVESEDLLDLVTAVSGSGPAYFFRLAELVAASGAQMGLPAELAAALSVQTCLGAGVLARDSGQSLAELRRQVTSPGGTTAAALQRFADGGLAELVRRAMQDCAGRAAELAAEYGGD